MEQSTILYLTLLISFLSLAVSVYSFFLCKKINVAQPPAQVLRYVQIKKEKVVAPVVIPVGDVTSVSAVIVETSDPVIVAPTIEQEVKKSTQQPTNKWELKITGVEGKEFDIHVQWSDNSSDIANGVAPTEILFEHKKGVTPQKVVGVAPNGDLGLSYSWKLNEFHW